MARKHGGMQIVEEEREKYNMQLNINKKVATQNNLDCGVHVCQWIELLANGQPVSEHSTLEEM